MEVGTNSKVYHGFDLNIPYVKKDFDVNPQNDSSSLIIISTHHASPHNTRNIEENEVQHAAEVETSNGASSGAEGVISEVQPRYIASVFATPSRGRRRCHHHHHHGGDAKQISDQGRFCTNFMCRTRRTPMWRKGPLGPKTLCNACGLQYIKTVKSRGNTVSGAGGASSTVHGDDDDDDGGGGAFHGPVPPETVEGENL
ncbi:hypothetical protein VNO80_28351 [Phaseolus coccineus]|uniref:GATA-type domain-containing protein n=1 Tax=Phaseolus coccineus TaxID=3886 RepID=A0AAN9LC81_PHACN